MGTSIVNYREKASGVESWGVLRQGLIHPLKTPFKSHREVMALYHDERKTFDADLDDTTVSVEQVEFNSPITNDIQLFCQGLNYADHRAESGSSQEPGQENLIFTKAPSSICGPNDTIVRPRDCKLLDYEIELALVMKTTVTEPTAINESNLFNYIGGIVLCNDVSARDLMFGSPMLQWFRGKSQRTFCPMGPVLYLMDQQDFDKLYSLQLTLKLNGEVKQSSSTGMLIYRPAETLAELSSFTNFYAGDCLLTGTPGGVLAGANLKVGLAILLNMRNDQKRRKKFTQAQLAQARFLEPGDKLELSIKTPDGEIDLGTQRNDIADE